MSSFYVALHAVGPMFLMLVTGVLVRKAKLLSDTELTHVNKVVFNVLFSAMMFRSAYACDFEASFDRKLLTFTLVGVLVLYALSVTTALLVTKDNRTRGAIVQALCRSNFVTMGLPVVSSIFGSEYLGNAAAMLSIVVPVFNILAIIALEIFRGGKVVVSHILRGVCKNPLVLGAIAGLALSALKIQLPEIISEAVADLAGSATPMALIVLGASFKLSTVKTQKWLLVLCVAGRLIVVPALALTIGALMGFRGVDFVILIAVYCSPCAVASYIMAQEMDSNVELSGNAVVLTSAFACVTMFCWIFLFRQLGMF